MDPGWLFSLDTSPSYTGAESYGSSPVLVPPGLDLTSPLTKVQQLLHGQRRGAVAREKLDLPGDQADAAQGAGTAHREAGRLHLDARGAWQALVLAKAAGSRTWDQGGDAVRPGGNRRCTAGSGLEGAVEEPGSETEVQWPKTCVLQP